MLLYHGSPVRFQDIKTQAQLAASDDDFFPTGGHWGCGGVSLTSSKLTAATFALGAGNHLGWVYIYDVDDSIIVDSNKHDSDEVTPDEIIDTVLKLDSDENEYVALPSNIKLVQVYKVTAQQLYNYYNKNK